MIRLLAVLALLIGMGAATAAPSHADDTCGAGMNWDWRHQVCQPGAPVPYPPYLPAQDCGIDATGVCGTIPFH